MRLLVVYPSLQDHPAQGTSMPPVLPNRGMLPYNLAPCTTGHSLVRQRYHQYISQFFVLTIFPFLFDPFDRLNIYLIFRVPLLDFKDCLLTEGF